MEKDDVLLQRRMQDLSNQAYYRGIPVFSDFLDLNELNILHTAPKGSLLCGYRTFGGYAFAERRMAAFLPDALSLQLEKNTGRENASIGYPLRSLEIAPAHAKFAEELTHRDYLGALMNLGLGRGKIGDILVSGKSAVVFVKEESADYIAGQLTKIRHTTVTATPKEPDVDGWRPRFQEIKGTVPSVRLDTVLSVAWPQSRSKLAGYIAAAKVFVNGKLTTGNGYRLKDGDLISVRGLGRIQYGGILSETKKGRYAVLVRKFI